MSQEDKTEFDEDEQEEMRALIRLYFSIPDSKFFKELGAFFDRNKNKKTVKQATRIVKLDRIENLIHGFRYPYSDPFDVLSNIASIVNEKDVAGQVVPVPNFPKENIRNVEMGPLPDLRTREQRIAAIRKKAKMKIEKENHPTRDGFDELREYEDPS